MLKKLDWRNLGVASLFLAAAAGCAQHPKTAGGPRQLPAVEVSTVSVAQRESQAFTSLAGSLRVRRQATLSSKLVGRILYLAAEEGDVVSAGSVVAEIDASDLQARTRQASAARDSALAQVALIQAGVTQSQTTVVQAQNQWLALQKQQGEARAQLDLAKSEAQRYQFLAAQGAIPRQRSEQATAELKVAESKLQQLQAQLKVAQAGVLQQQAAVVSAQAGVQRTQASVEEASAGIDASASDLSYAQVRAPFRGVVVEKMAYQGELNSPGRPLLKIQDLDSLEASIPVPESQIEKVQPGQVLKLDLVAHKRSVEAKVRQLVASTDPASRTFEVRLQLLQKPPKLFPGMYVKLLLPQERQKLTLVPASAITERGQLEGVFVHQKGRAEFRLLQLGQAQADGSRQVLSGLTGDEELIDKPSEQLQDGQQVKL